MSSSQRTTGDLNDEWPESDVSMSFDTNRIGTDSDTATESRFNFHNRRCATLGRTNSSSSLFANFSEIAADKTACEDAIRYVKDVKMNKVDFRFNGGSVGTGSDDSDDDNDTHGDNNDDSGDNNDDSADDNDDLDSYEDDALDYYEDNHGAYEQENAREFNLNDRANADNDEYLFCNLCETDLSDQDALFRNRLHADCASQMSVREVQADIKSVLRLVKKKLKSEQISRRSKQDVFPSRKERLLSETADKLAEASSRLRECFLRNENKCNDTKRCRETTTDREKLIQAIAAGTPLSVKMLALPDDDTNETLTDVARKLVATGLLARSENIFLAVDVLLLAASVQRCVAPSDSADKQNVFEKCAQIINQAAEICESFKNNIRARTRARELYGLSADLFSVGSMRIQRDVQSRRADSMLSPITYETTPLIDATIDSRTTKNAQDSAVSSILWHY